ncbi:MAG: potassium transporter [Pseudomonadales bacterium RIFCSPLOWO2_12_60_38]|uniref:Cation:proton antiporter n=1 Tax=Pseudomonas paracarnis TaxID=2750625 RepID=A0ABU6BZP3_9PSED|nr:MULTISPECIES: cation:proton antiporter [Pseudomonas]AFJ57290.1 transporter, monovalent cation:proton antiporter-2 (CPA2) family [Pseudomonas fluorescens A506]AOS76479.1 potassium transporter [Pseudomonas fluorescens]ETK42983.1 potassium transporter [Pseudomonas fluorescens FH5]OHC35441.1 MAG: potassium transporter [Pseudomonadales bacterium RIFCSPLOWO2_12_60_38]OHC41777.1 MAG: potassium transporter [Pseudomonadales bacterium RIFCSPLOWO2_12_FULL_59_450]PMZ76265.1 cation:proton antiporter [P
MHAISFIQDLAVIMLVAGVVTILFHRFKQPVVLGYIVAGFIIGPHTPPFGLIHDEDTIKTLAELGVIFLMFCLGLEFSLRKLFKVGATAFIAAFLEIVLMIWIGYEIGRWFDWSTMDSLFLGAILAISSTTIIVKALNDLKMKDQRFAQLIFGVLIVEDILGIGIIALLSSIAVSGTVSSGEVFSTVGKLSLFMIVALVIGILLVPRLLAYVAKFESNEMLLITVLGLCFGFCLLVVKLEYSMVLGAFLIGAIMAESRQLIKIEGLIEPVRDMFSAIFFVAIGLMIDPQILLQYAWPIAVITVAVVLGKMLSCGLGAFIAGNDGRTSLRVGMGLSQIGEFSFIIAALGMTLQVTSDFLYPVAVAVSAITTLLTPYLIRGADPLSLKIAALMPTRMSRVFGMYGEWLRSIQPQGEGAMLAAMIRKIILQVGVNLALVIAIFFAGSFFAGRIGGYLEGWVSDQSWQKALIWGGALLVSLPFLIAAYRKLKALSMLLAEMSVKPEMAGRHTQRVRRVIAELIPLLSLLVIFLLLAALSASILPTNKLLVLIAVVTAAVAAVLWRWFIRVHTRMQVALLETLDNHKDTEH